MFGKKYQIIIFKDSDGVCGKIRLGNFTLILIFFVFLSSIALNVFLWKQDLFSEKLQKKLNTAQEKVEKQKIQLVSLTNKIEKVQKHLAGVKEFDSKLRVMLNLEKNTKNKLTALGGTQGSSFSKDYLPLHRHELVARKMHNFLEQLNTEAQLEEVNQLELLQAVRSKHFNLAATPSIWPSEGWVTSGFGYRKSPFTGRREFHKGLDISAPVGTPIYAPASGRIVFKGRKGGYGLYVAMNHGNEYSTNYGHLHDINVKDGQEVKRGEIIGYVGNSGRSTGPHLHYEIRVNGVPVNPERYILN